MPVVDSILVVARYTVAAAFLLTCIIALVYWGVRRGKLNAFGPIARTTRRLADPLVRSIERRVIRWGGNPQDAPLWLIGIVLVVGLVFLSFIKWLAGIIRYVSSLSHGGPREWISFALDLGYFIIAAALILRVLGSWVGIGRYNRWMRFAYTLTDWLVEPIRRMLPGFGIIDFSPLVAWLVIYILRHMVLRGLFHI
jgi:YggT family protein